jgi:putative transposase
MLVAEGSRQKEDAKIQWDKRTNQFYYIYSYDQPCLADPDPCWVSKRVVACDPGCEPFNKYYSPADGIHGELLCGAPLEERLLKLDALHSRVAKHKGDPRRTSKQRHDTQRRLKRKLARERRRQHNWMTNAHYDAANFLLERYDVIIQPVLQVSKLVQRKTRAIQSKTVRSMLTWSHYLFRERLKSAATRYAGRHVIESREPGTSKTCTNCGHWKQDLKVSDKVYHCSRCKIRVCRQLAGARNNLFAAYGDALGMGWDGLSN